MSGMGGAVPAGLSRRDLLASALASQLAPAGLAQASAWTSPDSAGISIVEARIRELMQSYRIPALGIAACIDGRTVLAKGYGTASLPFGVPAQADTLFHSGSIGKHITAAGVLKLVEDGKADLGEGIGRYVGGLPPRWQHRSVYSLLTHTSGIPTYGEGIDWDRPCSRDTFLKIVGKLPSDFEAGESWTYSNTNYMLLGFLIENLSGKSYAEFTNDLLSRAGCRDSRVDDAGRPIANRAEPYLLTADGIRHAVRMESGLSAWPDGGVLMSARDIPVWDRSLDEGPTLSARSRALMWHQAKLSTGRTFPYGFGWWVEDLGEGRPFYWHTGAVPGFISFYMKAPADRLSLMVMTNGDQATSAPQRYIGQTIAELFAPGSTPLSLRRIRDREPEVTATARSILYRGTTPLDESLFAPEMTALIRGPIGQDAAWNFAESGEPDRFELVQESAAPGGRVRRYRITSEGRQEHMSFGYTRTGLIHWIWGV